MEPDLGPTTWCIQNLPWQSEVASGCLEDTCLSNAWCTHLLSGFGSQDARFRAPQQRHTDKENVQEELSLGS